MAEDLPLFRPFSPTGGASSAPASLMGAHWDHIQTGTPATSGNSGKTWFKSDDATAWIGNGSAWLSFGEWSEIYSNPDIPVVDSDSLYLAGSAAGVAGTNFPIRDRNNFPVGESLLITRFQIRNKETVNPDSGWGVRIVESTAGDLYTLNWSGSAPDAYDPAVNVVVDPGDRWRPRMTTAGLTPDPEEVWCRLWFRWRKA